jgi:hypothetical protein
VLPLLELEGDPGFHPGLRAGEPAALDLHRHLLLHLGEHLRHELAEIAAREDAAQREPLQHDAGEVDVGHGVERVAAAHDAGRHRLAHPGIAVDHEGRALAVIDDVRARADGRSIDLHLLAPEPHVLDARERIEQLADALQGHEAPAPRCHDAVDREVFVARLQAGGGERADERLLLVAAHDVALDHEARLLRREAVAELAVRGRPRRDGHALLRRGVERGDGGGHVRARVDRGLAVARPLQVARVQRDRGGDALARGADPHRDRLRRGPLAGDRAVLRELLALRPGTGETGLTDGVEQRVKRGLHGVNRLW